VRRMHRGYLVEPRAKISSGCQLFARCGSRSCRCQRTLHANALGCLTACRQREKPGTLRSLKLITGRLWDAHLRERTIASRCTSRLAAVVAHLLRNAGAFSRTRLTAQSPDCVDRHSGGSDPSRTIKQNVCFRVGPGSAGLGAIPFAAPASDRSKPRAKREMRTRS
jgi:hypothetical protein